VIALAFAGVAAADVPAAGPADPGCSGRGRVADVDRAVGRAEVAVQSLDATALAAALADSRVAMACLREPLGTHHVASWFRAAGIQAVGTGDLGRADDLLRAARSLEPAYVLDPDLGPPIQEAYAKAVPPSGPGTPLPPPAEGWVVVDGRPLAEAPPTRSYVLQWFGSDGAVRATRVMAPGEPPPYPLGETPIVAARPPGLSPVVGAPAPTSTAPRRHPSRTLALGGVATALVAGAGIGWAAALKEDIVELAPDAPDTLVATNRAVGYSAGGLGIAAVGLGVSAVVVARW
jgi:hypothetical protein